MPKKKKQKKKPQKRVHLTGWLTSDADEIERRRLRGASESFRIEPETPDDDFFGVYQVSADGGQTYRIEIRSLAEPINSCDCPDHRINGLGTCKHVEATLVRLEYRRKRVFNQAAKEGSPYFEIYLDRRDQQIRVGWPGGGERRSKARDLLDPFFNEDNILKGEPLDRLPAIQRAISASHSAVGRRIRLSKELTDWHERLDRHEQQIRSRQHFEVEVATGKATLDLVKYSLYPYQQEGMMHLAFTGRALLADEMGLGKTVQAVAACELLRRTIGIKRVLVISPASLKGEWEEQIGKFTDLSSHIIQGTRAKRLRQYKEPGFFFLANYEQVRPDVEEINSILAPDIIILDEAQRIKNWQTKTAISIKRLQSPYAFVLTGTPLENRIDEIYSIVQYLDPHIFGPLFRFNRDFYQLDDKGRATGYKNLDQLHARLQPIMLRRRKQQVEGQLPGRTINTYFVPMHKEQRLRYEEYEERAARLAAIAQKRPLTADEMKRLQMFLACMRMICDTPYILDQDCRIAPKMKELEAILQEVMEDDSHKVIIFSEWQRMLELVREQAMSMGLDYAWHTGKVPQAKRRDEIRRFKDDPECRLFLSTDSGAVGLNLQAANIVINLDLPWNPAKLEQRIARAWRKHQKRKVQVINLVTENSIEHRMLFLLDKKRSLAEGVVDGKGEREMDMPSGRAAFLERMNELFTDKPIHTRAEPSDPFEQMRDEVLSQWQEHLDLMELHGEEESRTLMVVADRADDALRKVLAQQLETLFPEESPQLTLLDRAEFATIQQLAKAGVIQFSQESAKTLYRAPEKVAAQDTQQDKRLAEAIALMDQGKHKQRMAKVLSDGGFAVEAIGPMREAVETALQALIQWRGERTEAPPSLGLIDTTLVQTDLLSAKSLSHIALLRDQQSELDAAQAEKLLTKSDWLFAQAVSVLDQAGGN